MAFVNLTADAIPMITERRHLSDFKPVLQITDIRQITTNTKSGGERYSVILSDGRWSQQGMLSIQLNGMVNSQQLQKGSIVQLNEFVCNHINSKDIILIIQLSMIVDTCDIIGDPKKFSPQIHGYENIPMERSPMQSSLNQPSTTFVRPHTNVGPPLHIPKTEHNGGVHSYKNERSAVPMQSYGNQPTTFARPNTYVRPPVNAPMSSHNSGAHSYNSSANNRMHSNSNQQPYNQIPPMYGNNRGPTAKTEAPERIIPIAALNPYQGKWTIKARVTAKGELRHYSNAKDGGKGFSFDLLDSDGGEIRSTCFNAVADQFYNEIEVGKVYYISRGTVKPANIAFNHLQNDHEITLDQMSTVQPCFDDDSIIPHQQFYFHPISDIEGIPSNAILDTIGVVYSITPIFSIMTKNQTETQKRSLSLKDMSGRSVDLILWGNFCNVDGQKIQTMVDSGQFPVLAVKNARVHEYNGKSIGTISSSQLLIEPDFPEAHMLMEWFDKDGRNAPSVYMSREFVSRTDKKTLSQIKDENLGTKPEKADYIAVNATICQIKVDNLSNFYYTACPNMNGDRKCSKKVLNHGDGTWKCEKCDKTFDECEYRYILQIQLQDHTGLAWVTAFQEAGEEIMGVSAKDLYIIRHEEQDEDKFTEAVRNVLFNMFSFKLKVKEETYGDDQRSVKSIIVKAEKVKLSSNAKLLLQDLVKTPNQEDLSIIAVNHGPTPKIGTVGQQASLTASHVGHFGSQYGGGSGGRMNSGVPSGGRVNSGVPSGGGSSGECYKCNQTGHWARDCPGVSSVPSGGQGNNGVPSGGRSSGASGECYKCGQSGHWARDCPGGQGNNGVPSGGGSSGASGECYKCKQSGHWARDCPGVSSVPSGGQGNNGVPSGGRSSGASGECFKCRQTGHWARDCPGGRVNIGVPSGGGSSGASDECYKCRQSGHWAGDCPSVSNFPSYGRY